jgi:predicted nucleic-acid-binding protein
VIGLDTNVLVRHLMQDDPAQYALARAFMANLSPESPGFISREVVVELVWVLEAIYDLSRQQIADAIGGLLGSKELIFETGNALLDGLASYEIGGPGLADRMIREAALVAGCETIVTFDRKLSRLSGVTLLT